jgi:hypothetical protein
MSFFCPFYNDSQVNFPPTKIYSAMDISPDLDCLQTMIVANDILLLEKVSFKMNSQDGKDCQCNNNYVQFATRK